MILNGWVRQEAGGVSVRRIFRNQGKDTFIIGFGMMYKFVYSDLAPHQTKIKT